MVFKPFDAENNLTGIVPEGEADSKEGFILEIKPNPNLNSLTYCVSNRDLALMQSQAKKASLMLKASQKKKKAA